MAVDSRITSKTYKTNVDELEPNDQNLKSDLYEVSIFNHLLKIAPGLVIQEDNLSYCYVYAIKNNKVVKKIGVYEKIEDDSDMFDLSTFSEGSLCLFDVYEKNPSLILELEDTETKSIREDVFDFILTKINDEEPEKKVELTKMSYKQILSILTSKKKEDSEDNKIITNLLNLIKKTIGDKKYYGEATQDKIKKYATDDKKKMLSLIVTEPFFGLRFIFTKNGEPIDDSEFRVWSIKSEIKEYVIVSENFEVIETYPADSLDAKYTLPEVEVETQDLDEEALPKEEPLPKSLSKTKAETKTKSVPRGTSLNAPLKKKEEPLPLSAIMEESESKSKSKAESKEESEEVDLNAGIDYKKEDEEVDLNAGIDYETEAKSKTKTKSKSKVEEEPEASKPKSKSKSKVETQVESKPEKSKLKTPGASIRPKSSQKK